MINLQITENGQNAVTDNDTLYFITFIASNSFDYEDMEEWRSNRYHGNAKFQLFPIAYLNVIPRGRYYADGYDSELLDHTIVEIVGAVETYKLDESFEINSIGLMATRNPNIPDIDGWSSFIFAFGSLELNTYPLPVNENDSMTYIIPFKVNYGDYLEPRVSAPDNLTPWKTFLEHNNSLITNPLQTHGLWIDLANMKFRVGGVTIRIPTSEGEGSDIDARIDAIYEQLVGAVKYKPNYVINPTTTFAAVDVPNNHVLDSKAKVLEFRNNRTTKTNLYDMVNSIAGSDILSINVWTATNAINAWRWNGSNTVYDYPDLWKSCHGYPLSLCIIPKNRYWYDYGVTYELIDARSNAHPGYFIVRFHRDPNITPSYDVYYTFFIVYDSWIKHFPPPFDPPFTPPS